jgi:two-component system, cell cycle sensor histidine kinase and response regulator CckA
VLFVRPDFDGRIASQETTPPTVHAVVRRLMQFQEERMARIHQKITFFSLPANITRYDGSHDGQGPGTATALESPPALTMDQTPGMIWTTDLELRVTQAQGTGLNYLDRSADQVVGLSLYDFFGTEDAEFGPIAAHRNALVGQAMNFEFQQANRTFFGVAEPLFDKDGDLCGTIANALDVTEYNQMHEECRQLEAKSREISKAESLRTFAGGVAHNFNNLLTVIMGYTALAKGQLASDSPIAAMLKEIDTATQTAADLTAQMLVYIGRTPGAMQPVQISQLIEELRPRFQASLTERIDLHLDLPADLPTVPADAALLHRMVMALFFNACEAIGPGPGVLTMRLRGVRVNRSVRTELCVEEPLPDGRYVWLQVSDTGAGMEEETRARIFEPFYSTKFTGRGLGLAAAQGIAHQHGGAISVVTKPGQGSIFHVLLPCERLDNED